MQRFNGTFTALFLIAGSLAAACGGSGSTGDPTVPDPGATPPPGSPGADAAPPEPPKAPVVTGTPDDSEINEMLGIFVAPRGAANGDGSRANPLLTVQAGIDRARTLGKRVYVCTGTYKEALVIADSISLIAGLDCSAPIWKTGAPRSRIEAPTSPAILAKDIKSPTRLEGLDIVAPNATAPGASSIGFFADHAAAITLAKSSVKAGDAANGADGTEGIQLVQSASAVGAPPIPAGQCTIGVGFLRQQRCGALESFAPAGAPGGVSVCSGAPNVSGLPGGKGGTGGLHETISMPTFPAVTFRWGAAVISAQYGEARPLPATVGANGADGAPAAALGSLSVDGYAGADGVAGTDGKGGGGGRGGTGSNPYDITPNAGGNWFGNRGEGGGAGGCPGLAGTPGKAGGASIALALIESPLVVDSTQLTAGKGGAGGRGTFGSDPTEGAASGAPLSVNSARPGGNGGFGGISTNGSSGPSVGILHSGPPAKLQAGGRATASTGGAAVPEQSRTGAFGTVRTIPATPAGLAQDILAQQ